jgi:hypothetical protein
MDLLRWMGRTFVRFVAVSVAILGDWMFILNIGDGGSWAPWAYVWILASGLAGAVGGVLYLLSLDGPPRFRTKQRRIIGWGLMLASVLLPTSLTFMLVPLVLLMIPTLFRVPGDGSGGEPITSG